MDASPRSEMEEKIIAKAWKDESFREALLRDPKAALKQEFGYQFPPNTNVQVVEENNDTFYLVLPMNPEAELSTGELDSVAGGFGGLSGPKPRTCGCYVTPSSASCSDLLPDTCKAS